MPKVLVACEMKKVAEIIDLNLRICGHDVKVVTNGREALSLVKSDKPRLLITSICLTSLHGLQLAETIKADPSMRETAIILLTPENASEALFKALTVVEGHLGLPLNPMDLVKLVERIIAPRHAM